MALRRRQLVSTFVERRDVLRWMLNYEQQTGSTHRIASLTVDAFPDVFVNRKNCPKLRSTHRRKYLSGGKIVNQ